MAAIAADIGVAAATCFYAIMLVAMIFCIDARCQRARDGAIAPPLIIRFDASQPLSPRMTYAELLMPLLSTLRRAAPRETKSPPPPPGYVYDSRFSIRLDAAFASSMMGAMPPLLGCFDVAVTAGVAATLMAGLP